MGSCPAASSCLWRRSVREGAHERIDATPSQRRARVLHHASRIRVSAERRGGSETAEGRPGGRRQSHGRSWTLSRRRRSVCGRRVSSIAHQTSRRASQREALDGLSGCPVLSSVQPRPSRTAPCRRACPAVSTQRWVLLAVRSRRCSVRVVRRVDLVWRTPLRQAARRRISCLGARGDLPVGWRPCRHRSSLSRTRRSARTRRTAPAERAWR